MRIIFIGAVQFSKSILERLISIESNVVGVCTSKSSRLNSDYVDLSPLCTIAGLPYLHTTNINGSETLEWIKEKTPDVIFCFGWSHMLKIPLLQIPPLGVVGYHPTLLPQNRGRHPLVWALILGLKETGSTFFFMDEGADSGDIISQRTVLIEDADDAGSLYNRITSVALDQIDQLVPALHSGVAERVPQDHTKANYWRKRNVSDGVIDWKMTAQTIHNLVRGLARPYVGAQFTYREQLYKVWESELLCETENICCPGEIIKISKDGIVISTGRGSINLLEVEPELRVKTGGSL